MGGLDAKIFGIKDVITILFVASGFFAQWYTMDDRMGDQEDLSVLQAKEIAELKEANKAYVTLPKDVKDLTIAHEKTAKVVEAIYLGLVANGTIKPPQ